MPRAQTKDAKPRKLFGRGESKPKSSRIANAVAAVSPGKAARKGKGRSFDSWSKADLIKRAREIGLKGRSTMNKTDLIKALRKRLLRRPR
jgi:hypothetical protein